MSLGLLGFLLLRVDLESLLVVLSSARFVYIAVAIGAYLLGQVISSIRWSLLAWPLGFHNPFKDFILFYFIGMFFNLFAPSTVGGDVSRVFYLARDGNKRREKSWTISAGYALVTVVADRAIGTIVLVWLGAIALMLFPAYTIPSPLRGLVFGIALTLLAGSVLLPVVARILEGREFALGKRLLPTLISYRAHWKVVPQALFLSLLVHLIQSWMQVLIGHALQVDIPWSYAVILYPLVGVFTALPISLNGIGLREGGYMFLLHQIGIGSEKAVAFGLLWLVIVVVNSLIGGAIFVLRKSPRPSPIISEIQS